MARFVVLDHSLIGMGGHHYEQAVQILQAADRLGLEPVLSCQPALHAAPSAATPLASADRLCGGIARLPGRLSLGHAGPAVVDRGTGGWHPTGGAVAACGTRCGAADVAELPASPPHGAFCVGLCRDPRANRFAEWGPRVHSHNIVVRPVGAGTLPASDAGRRRSHVAWAVSLRILQGREPQYAQQEAVERQVRRQLEYLLQHFPRGRLRLYGTTQRLVEQYNRLSLSEFEVLPFPVDAHALRGAAPPEASRKLRLTCAGYLRREKGKVLASRFVEGLWSNELASGHMQLVVQTNRRQAVRMLPRNAVVPMDFKSALSDTDVDPIVWLRHPLTREAYVDLIRQSDMAVFLHEDRAYYTRCSGVLVEMLAGGVPVLVPAGSWLADQVSESIYEHLDGLRSTAPGIGRAAVARVQERTGYPGTGGSVLSLCGGTAADAACELEVPAGTSRPWSVARGTLMRVRGPTCDWPLSRLASWRRRTSCPGRPFWDRGQAASPSRHSCLCPQAHVESS